LPGISTTVRLISGGTLDGLALFVMTTMLIGVGIALIAGSPRFLLAKEAWVTAVGGLWFLISVRGRRPLAFLFARPLLEGRRAFTNESWNCQGRTKSGPPTPVGKWTTPASANRVTGSCGSASPWATPRVVGLHETRQAPPSPAGARHWATRSRRSAVRRAGWTVAGRLRSSAGSRGCGGLGERHASDRPRAWMPDSGRIGRMKIIAGIRPKGVVTLSADRLSDRWADCLSRRIPPPPSPLPLT
jgi:hypothetical protein